jgi:hypothetical protein
VAIALAGLWTLGSTDAVHWHDRADPNAGAPHFAVSVHAPGVAPQMPAGMPPLPAPAAGKTPATGQ